MNDEALPPPSVETSLALINERLEGIEAHHEPKFKVADFLTSITIATSVFFALLSWSKDRDLVRREQAQQVRAGASSAMGKLDRCNSLVMSLFDSADEVFEKNKDPLTSLAAAGKLKPSDVVAARNQTFNDLLKAHNSVVHNINDLQVETGYIDIKGQQETRKAYKLCIKTMRDVEEKSYKAIQEFTQDKILSYDPSAAQHDDFSSGEFWTYLAGKTRTQQLAASAKMAVPLHSANTLLESIIDKEDKELVK